MSLVRSYNKKRDITYVYESISYWDPVKKVHSAHRTLVGKIDRETGEIVPTRHTSRKKLSPAEKQAAWKAKRAAENGDLSSSEKTVTTAVPETKVPLDGTGAVALDYREAYEELQVRYSTLEKRFKQLEQECQRQRDFFSEELAKQAEILDDIRVNISSGIIKNKKLQAFLQE